MTLDLTALQSLQTLEELQLSQGTFSGCPAFPDLRSLNVSTAVVTMAAENGTARLLTSVHLCGGTLIGFHAHGLAACKVCKS